MARRAACRRDRPRAPFRRIPGRSPLNPDRCIPADGTAPRDDAPRGAAARGAAALLGACTIWGLSPLFYAALSHVPAAEVLAHRTLWSAAFFGAIVAAQGRLGRVADLARAGAPRGRIAAATLMISINWFLFIWAVQAGRTVEASLGYYIFPLIAVLLGRLLFGETLSAVRWGAIALAALGVMVLTWGLGVPPYVSLVLAVSFGLYGVAKKGLDAPALISVLAEVLLLVPLALLWLVAVVPGMGAMATPRDAALLVATGPITAMPLILFSYATRRLTMASLGIIGYLNPSLQFLCAVAVLGERITRYHVVAFGLIWTALALYSASSLRRRRHAA